MEQVYTSDEPTGRKLVSVASGVENPGPDNPGLFTEDNDAGGTNHLKHRQMGSERTPLIRPRRPTDSPEDTSSQDNSDSGFPTIRYGSIAWRRIPPVERENNSGLKEKIKKTLNVILESLSRPINSVMMLLFIIIIGIVLVFAANLKTDSKAMQVKPQYALIYLMFLISVFVAWTCIAVIPQKLHCSSRHDGTLIPSHLLTGIGIFGTVSATTQILYFLDFVKCSHHVDNLSYMYAFYPIFKIIFVYFQMYFFYKLSRNGFRHASLPGGTFFVMVTLATNLCIWAFVFVGDASADPKLENISWLTHYHYGVENFDPCASANLTSPGSLELHTLVRNLSPYISTFSIEYALLASGLLLHIWMVIKSPIPRVPKPKKQSWTLWRIGFILGLLSIPIVFVAYMKEQTQLKLIAPKVILYVLKAIIFLALMSFCGLCIFRIERSGFIKTVKPMKLEIKLLGTSGFLGFPAFDLACIFAGICEWQNTATMKVIWYIVLSLSELICTCVQYSFIKKAYQYKLPVSVPRDTKAKEMVEKAAKSIRQYASFALVLNIAYWGAKTYDLRRHDSDPSIAEQYFGKYTWFSLTHFSLPLCIFFYFHIAICYANVVSSFSQFGPLWSRSNRESE